MAAETRTMSLEDVPIELRKLAIAAATANSALSSGDRDQTPDHMLAAVLPAHEQMVREQICRDLLDERRKVAEQEGATARDNDVINGICNGLIAAVRIVASNHPTPSDALEAK